MLYLLLSSGLLLSAFILLSKRFINKELAAFYYAKIERKVPLSREKYWKLDQFLQDKIVYYRHLNDEGKARFIYRLLKFIHSKKFEGREGLEVSSEIMYMVGAAAIQLTFGFKNYLIDQLDSIWIYPSAFYSKLYRQSFKGATAPSGRMFLSAQHLKEGYMFPFDGINLGIHEMSHALMLSIEHAAKVDHRFAVYYDEWMQVSHHAYINLKKGNPSILRKYGGVNEAEFFAVCVEHFFESPEEFQKELPNVYNHLCLLLNQDPQNTANNYILEKGFEERHNGGAKVLIPLPLMLLGLSNRASGISYRLLGFAGFIAFISNIVFANIYAFEFKNILAAIILLATGVYYGLKPHLVDGKVFTPLQFGGAAAAVIAPVLISMSFTINYFLPVETTYSMYKDYRIGKLTRERYVDEKSIDSASFNSMLIQQQDPNALQTRFKVYEFERKNVVGIFGMTYTDDELLSVIVVKEI